MELRNARLCLDCEEVHDLEQCPVCGSETFSFITRWVPAAAARQRRPRPTTSEDADVYKQLISGEPASKGRRLLKQSVLGLTALGVAGLFWGSREARKTDTRAGGPSAPESED
jgi:hypothetical protein